MAGTALAQRNSGANDKTIQDAAAHDRTRESKEKAVKAEGVGSDDNESEASRDRDADGRQAWQWNHRNPQTDSQPGEKSIDLTGQSGNILDLSG